MADASVSGALRTIVVTGASSGVGRALAERAADAGYGVLAVGRDASALATLASAAKGTPGAIEPLALDLTAPGAAARVVAAALARFGRIDVLVNNAGSVTAGPIAEQSDAALREQFDVHAIVPLALTREALPSLRASRGHVFFVGSGVARVPVGGLGAYPSAKAAIRNAARVARAELHPLGIAVTYLDPGAVDTPFMSRAGLAGAPKGLARPPEAVARRIVRAIGTRPATVNAVPWQTAFIALAELFPGPTDFIVSRFPNIVGSRAIAEKTPKPKPASAAPAPEPEAAAPALSDFDLALAPVARRMERLKLSRTFVAQLLEPGVMLVADDVALRWAGMPNKNERALIREVLEALGAAHFVERESGGAYRVLRTAG